MKIYENLMKIYSGRMYQTSVRLLLHSTIDVPSGRMYQKWSNVSDFRQTSDTLHHRPSITTYFHIAQQILTDSQRFPFSVKIGLRLADFENWCFIKDIPQKSRLLGFKHLLQNSFPGLLPNSGLKTCRPAHFGAPILSGIEYHLGGVWNLELGTWNLEIGACKSCMSCMSFFCRVCRVCHVHVCHAGHA